MKRVLISAVLVTLKFEAAALSSRVKVAEVVLFEAVNTNWSISILPEPAAALTLIVYVVCFSPFFNSFCLLWGLRK